MLIGIRTLLNSKICTTTPTPQKKQIHSIPFHSIRLNSIIYNLQTLPLPSFLPSHWPTPSPCALTHHVEIQREKVGERDAHTDTVLPKSKRLLRVLLNSDDIKKGKNRKNHHPTQPQLAPPLIIQTLYLLHCQSLLSSPFPSSPHFLGFPLLGFSLIHQFLFFSFFGVC